MSSSTRTAATATTSPYFSHNTNADADVKWMPVSSHMARRLRFLRLRAPGTFRIRQRSGPVEAGAAEGRWGAWEVDEASVLKLMRLALIGQEESGGACAEGVQG